MGKNIELLTSNPQPHIILASSSIYRQQILERLGLKFECQSPDIDETPLPNEPPKALVERLSISKAQAVAADHPNAIVIGSDQVSELSGNIIGKPKDHADAMEQLKATSGKVSMLYSGIAVINSTNNQAQSDVVTVEVECRDLTDNEIERYLQQDKPYNSCGSIKVESLGITLLNRVLSDDPNAITGMPVILLCKMLRREGVFIP